jgi:TonB family protein
MANLNLENKKSTVASLILHIALIITLIGFKSAHIIIPSRSNGIEVSLVTNDAIAPTARTINPVKTIDPIKTLDNPADVNIKQDNAKNSKKPPSKIIQPVVSKDTDPQTLQQKVQKKNKKQNPQINDLLDQIEPATKSTGKGKSAATGGINGSSDSTNMVGDYADAVIERVRPFVVVPDGLDANAKAIVQVTLLPNMEVYEVKLLKSSGNTEYDNNVQTAINRVKVFPPLPDGAEFTDYRKLRLAFKPQ